MTQSNRHQQNMHHSVYLQPLLDKHGKGEGITFEDLQLSWKSLEQHCRNCQHQHQGKGHDKGKEPSTTSAATTIKSPILSEMEALHKSLLDSYHATAKKYYTSILTNCTPPTLKPSAPRKGGGYAATSTITNPSSGSDSDSVASAFAAAEYISQNMSIIRPTLDKWSGIDDDKVDEWLWTPLKHKLHNAYKKYFLLEKRQRMKQERADAEVVVVPKVVGRTKYLEEEGHEDKKATLISASKAGTTHSRGSSNVNSMVNTPKAPNSTPTSTCGASTTIATNESDINESLLSKITPSSEKIELELKVIKEEVEVIINNQTNINVTNSNEERSQQSLHDEEEEGESHEENEGDGESGSEREEDDENEDENVRDDGDGDSDDGFTSIVNKAPTSTSTCSAIAPTTTNTVSTKSNTKKRTGMIAIGLNPPRKRFNSNLNVTTGVGGTVTKRKRTTNINSNKNHNNTNNNNTQGQSSAAGSSSGGGGGGRGNNRKKPRNNRAKRGRGKAGGRGSTK
mmetsp:Transcript_11753/g.17798  ORF Transcript_11753/g.17798 Transcript_11753/m.17798 type:complete len:510 (-) Transcript_11753:156-1685(-)|eukprot:CAMPEP_0194126098 /NCGR_PEP_ID=MMETSP0150-20130528/59811_1 /TAXON_ID=122233 /ORGANISM="Chaetoceros debilis, Strain MM31A-1" /LENGTH=509 /DNA_ID=CAMNT_0038819943 /DNA_START=428 /DNA_END=1957 /DNA_ORIENTATION=+